MGRQIPGLIPRRNHVSAAVVVGSLLGSFSPGPAHALPPGRAWAPTTGLAFPGLVQSGTPRLEVDTLGRPLLIHAARWDTTASMSWMVATWGDSAWVPLLLTGIPADYFPEPVISLKPAQHLVWISLSGPNLGLWPLLFVELLPNPGFPEHTMWTYDQSSEYGAAVSARRRWVVRSQQRGLGETNFVIRTVYSDTVRIWRELPELGKDDSQCTIAPLGDYEAMVVYSTEGGVHWARAEGERWAEDGTVDPRYGIHPRLRLRPSGGLWLAWADGRSQMHLSTYRDGAWQPVDSVGCAHAPGETYLPAWNDVSRDGFERPVIAWGDLAYGYLPVPPDVGCVSFPTDSGWSQGEEIPGSEGMWLTPKVTRDRNGDAWLAWRLKSVGHVRYTHTYVSAIPSRPSLAVAGRQRVVSWTLSEPAPESRWTVWRARGPGPFVEVGEVRAGGAAELSWTDPAPPEGPLRYKVRRESLDLRYRLDTEEALWPEPERQALRFAAVPAPFRDGMPVELVGAAAGTIELILYDLQGRRVHRQVRQASGTGQDTLELPLSGAPHPTAGVYFLVARDASGRTTSPARLVLLR
jgi:hypothetical protein